MSTRTRSLHRLAAPVLTLAVLLGLGCASTSSTPEPAAPEATAPKPEVTIRQPMQQLTPVYFDTDRAVLRKDAQEALTRYAKSIASHPEWGVLTIEGHCDERGSDAYNLDLGKRRAEAVRRYLVDAGVPSSRLQLRSFGEQRPAVIGREETAWRLNRRSEIRADALQSALR